MKYQDLPAIIRRALVHGVAMYPIKIDAVLRQYDKTKIPSEFVERMSKSDLEMYIDALHLSSMESARDWTRGHEMLIQAGFTRIERKEGHRIFISMVWGKKNDN